MAKNQTAKNVKKRDELKKEVESKTLEELRTMEQEAIAACDEIDKKVSKKEFDLPTENYVEVANAIRTFLDKKTVQWQYTLAMVGMYDFWDPDKKAKKIPYAQLDSVLRILGELQFTGYNEWAMVVAVNKYFEPLHNAYVEVTQEIYDAATRHSIIMDAMQKKDPAMVNKDMPEPTSVEIN